MQNNKIGRVFNKIICGILLTASIKAHAATPEHTNVPPPPLPNDFAKEVGVVAKSVFRVVCPISDRPNAFSHGTGFLHKSGYVITAAHVVKECKQIFILKPNNEQVEADLKNMEPDLDLALLEPKNKLGQDYLSLYTDESIQIGQQVATWGYPAGYHGVMPLLTIGYLSGVDGQQLPSGKVIGRYVVNSAFNSGNSGGPLIDVQSGKVIGVVDSKLAPLSQNTIQGIQILKKMNGMTYGFTTSDGREVRVSPNDVISSILDDLRGQIQLVIGYAVMSKDIIDFVHSENVQP